MSSAQLFAYAAALPCDQLQVDCLDREQLLNLSGCMMQQRPEGVPEDVFKAFCAHMAQCGLFDAVGCEPEASQLATEVFGPPTDCLSADQREFFAYCDRYGTRGPDIDTNQLCWAAQVSPHRTAEQRGRPSCPDVDCLTEDDMMLVGSCIAGRSSCPGQDWADAVHDLPVCPGDRVRLRQKGIQEMAPDGCLRKEIFDFVVYCLENGQTGPDPAKNAGCYGLDALGLTTQMSKTSVCGTSSLTPAQQVEIRRRVAAGQQATTPSAEEPVVVAPQSAPVPSTVPSAEEPTLVQPALVDTGPASTPQPDAPPQSPETGGVSRGWMIGGGVALLAAIGAGVYFTRKR